jgi:lipid II:glycine glycyltransferase (peptidoglycan interpeptide bridge formation enzyme)
MIKIREVRPEDKEAWNRVAQESPHATYAHTWEWKQTLERGFGVRPLCLVAEQNGDLVGIYPAFLRARFEPQGRFVWLKMLCFRKAQVLWSPLYLTWDYGGPCVAPHAPSTVCQDLCKEMERRAQQHGAIEIRVSPYGADSIAGLLLESGYKPSDRLTAVIDLKQPEEALWNNLKGETRSQVRQGSKLGVEVVETTDSSGLEAFHACMVSVSERTGMKLPVLEFFRCLLDNLAPGEMVRIYLAKHQGGVIGCALVLCHRGTVVTRYWGAYHESFKLRPYHVLIWRIILEAKRRGCHTCDFGGMPLDENNGIYKFKKGWGVRIERIDWYIKPLSYGRLLQRVNRLLSGRRTQ